MAATIDDAARAGMGAPTTGAFGDMLKEYRRAAGLTQEALAERADVGVRRVRGREADHGA